MTYLLTKMIVCLCLVGILGWLLGWMFRGSRAKLMQLKSESEWQVKLASSEQGAVALKTGLEKSNHQVKQLRTDYGELVNDNKTLADEYSKLNTFADRTRKALKAEREKAIAQEKQYAKKSQLLSNELSLIKSSTVVMEADLEKHKQLEISNNSTILDLNGYLETANIKSQQSQDEAYQLGKSLNEASIAITQRDKAIEALQPKLAERDLQIKQQAQELENFSNSHTDLLTKIEAIGNQLQNSKSTSEQQNHEAARQLDQYRQQLDQLQRREAELEKEKIERESAVSRLNSEAETSNSKLITLQQQHHESNLKLAELKRLNQQYTAEFTTANNYQKEADQLKQMLLDKDQNIKQLEEKLAADCEQRDEEKKSLRSILDSTQDQLQNQLNNNGELEQRMITIQKQYDDRERVLEQTQQRLNSAENTSTDELAELQRNNSEQQHQLAALQLDLESSNQKVTELQQANLQLSDLIEKRNISARIAEEEKLIAEQKLAEETANNDQQQSQSTAQKTGLSEGQPASFSAPRMGVADDLKRISGIGPKIEGTLNDLGVYHFDQISNFTAENVNWVNDHLSFKGRIEREGWIEQAKALTKGTATEFSNRYDKKTN